MEKILYLTDFSKNSTNALPFAAKFAEKLSDRIILLNIEPEPFIKPHENIHLEVSDRPGDIAKVVVEGDLKNKALEKLRAMAKDFIPEGIPHECIVEEGEVEHTVAKVVKEKGIGLVVMATMGDRAENHTLLGSTAHNLLSKIDCPIFIVPPGEEINRINNFTYVTDLVHAEQSIISEFVNLAKAFNANVTLVHVLESLDNYQYASETLNRYIKESGYSNMSFNILEDENALEGLHRYLENNVVDVMGITTHTKSLYDKLFHHSVTSDLVWSAEVPMLVFSQKFHNTIFI